MRARAALVALLLLAGCAGGASSSPTASATPNGASPATVPPTSSGSPPSTSPLATPSVPSTATASPTPATAKTPPPGWMAYSGTKQVPWSIEMPGDWSTTLFSEAGDVMAAHGSAEAGSLHVIVDTGTVAKGDFTTFIEHEKETLSKSPVGGVVTIDEAQVTLPGGTFTRLTVRDDGGGTSEHGVSARYFFQIPGKGVISLYCATVAAAGDLVTIPAIPPVWADMAATFNPLGTAIP